MVYCQAERLQKDRITSLHVMYRFSQAPDYNKLTWLEAAIQTKTKHVTSMNCVPEPMIWAHDTGQQIPSLTAARIYACTQRLHVSVND